MANNKTKLAHERLDVVQLFDALSPLAFFQRITDRALRKTAAPWQEHTAHPRRSARKNPRRTARKNSRRTARKKKRSRRAA